MKPQRLFTRCGGLLLLLAFFLVPSSQILEARTNPVLRVSAPHTVGVGEPITLTLAVQGMNALGGYEALVLFDPTVAEFAALHRGGSDLARDDRHVGAVVVPELPQGSAVGLFSCAAGGCPTPGAVTVPRADPDTVQLATVELVARAPGSLEIRLAGLRVVDQSGQTLTVSDSDQAMVVQVGAEGEGTFHPAPPAPWTLAPTGQRPQPTALDVTGEGSVTQADLMEVALEWQITHERGAPCGKGADLTRDVTRDGCVDVADLQAVAAHLAADVAAPMQDVAGAATLTVNSVGDQSDARAGNGVCRTSVNTCTLRAAIQEANALVGPDTILFNIPGSGVQTIQLGQRLPTLYDASGPTTIDGYSQPGAAPNSHPTASNATILIQVVGNGEQGFDGLPITSGGHVVRGLSISKVVRAFWIYGTNARDNLIAGNFIGINAAGTYGAPDQSPLQAHGVHIEQGADNNRIGTAALADRNVISGNGRHALGMWHDGTDGNIVLNNIVGLNPSGTARLANRKHGLDINYGAAYNRLGGTQPGERNVVSGNDGSATEISHGAETTGNQIIGNFVGTDLTGNAAPHYTYNRFTGISLKDRVVGNYVSGNVVGNNQQGGIVLDNYGTCCVLSNTITANRVGVGLNGAAIPNLLFGIGVFVPQTQVGPGNIVAFNPVGIQVDGNESDGNTLTQNSIYNNTGLGIDLGPIGTVNANDPGDGDSGPNEGLNFPVLTSASATMVEGTACAGCTVEVFIADRGQGGYGQGKTFVGATAADSEGSFRLAPSGLTGGSYVTATATDAAGNTSEFSSNRFVSGTTPNPPLPVPGRIEAEAYSLGGEGVGYHDTTAGNSGGAYRNDDVDIQATQDTSGSYNIGWVEAGEWLVYDVTIAAEGSYRFTLRAATRYTGRRYHIEVDGVDVTGPVSVPVTGGWQSWADALSPIVHLPAGSHTLRLVADTASINMNYLTVSAP